MFQLIQRTGTADWKFYFCHFYNINLKMPVENLYVKFFFSKSAWFFSYDLQFTYLAIPSCFLFFVWCQFAFHFQENLSQNIKESLNGVLWSETKENDYNNLLLFLEHVMWRKWFKCMHSWTFFLGCHFKSPIFPWFFFLSFFLFLFFIIFLSTRKTYLSM